MLAALILIELVRRDALDAVAVPNKASLLNQPDDDPGESSHEDIAGEQRMTAIARIEPRRKSAQLRFVVAVETGKLLVHVSQNRHTRARGQCRRRQHLIDRAGGKLPRPCGSLSERPRLCFAKVQVLLLARQV